MKARGHERGDEAVHRAAAALDERGKQQMTTM